MRKSLSILSSILLSLALLLSACAMRAPAPATGTPESTSLPEVTRTPTPEPSPTAAVPHGTLTLWHSWEEAQRPALLRRIAAFQERYPDVQFDVQYVPSVDLRLGFEAAAAEGSGPAILIGPAAWGPELYDRGFLADLAALAPPPLLRLLSPAALGSGQYRGALVGVPLDLQGVVLFRNRKIIPLAPVTFDSLVELAREATRGEQIGAILDRSLFYSAGHLYGLGGSLLGPDGEPAFNNELGLKWIHLLRTFEGAGPPDYFTDKDLETFKEGRVGFIVDGTWNLAGLAEAIGPENLVVDPWPELEQGRLSGFVQAENIYLRAPAGDSSAEEDLQLAWLFVEFLLSPESQASLLEVGLIPALAPINLPPSGADPLLEAAMQALSGGTAYPVLPELALYTTPLDIALRSVFESGADPQAALQSAEEAILSARAGATPAP